MKGIFLWHRSSATLILSLLLTLLFSSTPAGAVDYFLHSSSTDFLDNLSPAGTTAKFKDSASLNFAGGNLWKEIGTWRAVPALASGTLTSLGSLHVWLGLKNSDDQGTRFDLRAEVYKDGALVATGLTRCITGVTRNAAKAKEVTVSFDPVPPVVFNGTTEVLSLRILTRIGTNADDSKCPGHSNAVGLRLYYDAVNRPSRFGASFAVQTPSLQVTITSPAPGSIIEGSSVLVLGEVVAPTGTEVGVTINDAAGLVSNGQFAALVPVDPSVTALTATVTDTTGSSGSDTVPVSVQPAPSGSPLLFRPSPAVGLAPLTVSFNLVKRTAITEISLDLDGDGTTDFTGPDLEGQAFAYSGPGLYFPTVMVTDTAGVTQTASALVLVYDQTTFDTLIQSKWQGMKDALRQGDIDGALNFVSLSKRDSYRRMLEALGPQTANIDQILSDISFVKHQGLRVEYQMIRIDDGVRISHFVLFVLDNDGIWRIRFF